MLFFTDSKLLIAHVSSDMRRKSVDSKFWRALGPVSAPAMKLADVLKVRDLIGATYPEVTSPALFLNIDSMVGIARVLDHAHPEIVEAAIRQNVHTVWRHEREHLIRAIDPNARQEGRRTQVAQVVTSGAVSGLITMGSLYFMPENPTGDPRIDAFNAFQLIITPAYALMGSQLVTDKLWYPLLSPAEKAARLQGITGKNLPNLFDFKFEKGKL